MYLLICLVTYNRLEYTKRTIESLLGTIEVPYYLVVVDNCSKDGSVKWLKQQHELGVIDKLVLNPVNYYPGKACNLGWEAGLETYPIATHLMRVDNDMEFFKGWSKEIEPYFKAFPKLGLLGLDYNSIKGAPKTSDDFGWRPFFDHGPNFNMPVRSSKKELELVHWPGSVGGLCIIKKQTWDEGVRYTERPWYDGGQNYISPQEDSMLTINILRRGYEVGHIGKKVAQTFGDMKHWKDYADYSMKVLVKRGYHRMFSKQVAKLTKK